MNIKSKHMPYPCMGPTTVYGNSIHPHYSGFHFPDCTITQNSITTNAVTLNAQLSRKTLCWTYKVRGIATFEEIELRVFIFGVIDFRIKE